MVIIQQCTGVAIKQDKVFKQYVHTYHVEGNTVCVTPEWKTLPLEYMMGLIAHEVGYLLVGDIEHCEKEADRLANMFFNVRIRYRDSAYGRKLPYLSSEDTNTVYGWVLDNAKFTYPLHV